MLRRVRSASPALMGEVVNGDSPATGITVTFCSAEGIRRFVVPGVLEPGQRAPFFFADTGLEPDAPYQVVAAGRVATEDDPDNQPTDLEVTFRQVLPPDDESPVPYVEVEFRNNGEDPVLAVEIWITVTDADGRVVLSTRAPIEGEVLPGESALYVVELIGLSEIPDDYDVTVRVVGYADGELPDPEAQLP